MRALLCLVVAACGARSGLDPSSAPKSTHATHACAPLDLKACDASPDCHPVFELRWDCSGDCLRYERCELGAPSCTKSSPNCDEPDPKCEQQGDFRVKWGDGCHDGCVRAADCRS